MTSAYSTKSSRRTYRGTLEGLPELFLDRSLSRRQVPDLLRAAGLRPPGWPTTPPRADAARAAVQEGGRDHRSAVAPLRLPGQRKRHWRDENDQRRKLLTAAVAELEPLYVVVVRVERAESSERRRRICLRRLLCELDEAGVDDVYLEAREAKQNQRDLQLLGILRAERTITSAIRMAHLAGPLEALLWLPDLVAGAVGAARQGHCGYLDQLSGQLTILKA